MPVIVKVAVPALPVPLRLTEVGLAELGVHVSVVMPAGGVQVTETDPLKPFVAVRFRVSVTDPVAANDTIEFTGTSVKSDKGFDRLTVVDEGA